MEQNQLQTENTSLHRELSTVTGKLNKVQQCYKQAEQENMHLAEDLRDMERDRVKLYEEKMKLQVGSGTKPYNLSFAPLMHIVPVLDNACVWT